ncbi:MAG: hypothetical protein ACK46X_10825, partial [Candidatus Sericytochromatia bacterium]
MIERSNHHDQLLRARQAGLKLATADATTRKSWLLALAELIEASEAMVLAANAE